MIIFSCRFLLVNVDLGYYYAAHCRPVHILLQHVYSLLYTYISYKKPSIKDVRPDGGGVEGCKPKVDKQGGVGPKQDVHL